MFIYAWAKSRKDIGAKLEENTRPLIRHLIKLFLYPESTARYHWRAEVANYLDSVPLIKSTHRFPSADLILNYTWRLHRPRLKHLVEVVEKDYGKSDVYYTLYGLSERIEEYYTRLADMLARDDDVAHTTIYELLDELGF